MEPLSSTTRPTAIPPFHATAQGTVLQQLGSGPGGLDEAEARLRLERYGPNQLAPAKRRGPLRRLIGQFNNILLYVMMGAAVVTAGLEHWLDTGVLLAAIVINAIIGFIQEGKAENALDAIRTMLAPHALVIRNGRRYEVDAAVLVPGDIVVLNPGDRVPADLRLIAVKDLRIDEAALTGESLPVEKTTQSSPEDASPADQVCMAFSGTVCLQGQASGVIVATGMQTELGQINRMLAGIQRAATPLIRQINGFSYWLALVILGLGAVTFVFGTLVRNMPASEMFMMVVAMVASAIPEGLPVVLTVTLALGVQRMARQKAVVRRLAAVETLGSVTVICTDKTGTLTRNEMTVERIVCAGRVIEVSGVGYMPTGALHVDGRQIAPDNDPVLVQAIRAGVLCNDAILRNAGEQWFVDGDPTEGALLALGHKAGLLPDTLNSEWPRIDSLPFESVNRYMATYHLGPDRRPWIFAKGAPERILELCSGQSDPAGEAALDVDYWRRMATDLAARGLRLLAIAATPTAPEGPLMTNEGIDSNFTMLALVGIVDLPREEAIHSVRNCHDAGISVKMITGDHADTARAIGAQLGIGAGKPSISGSEIALMDASALQRVVADVDIFARASPEHKLRLVEALQHNGQTVAMTGDGVNDAPALKRADVGVAMGLKGTEAAKDAADLVLADDNFATIVVAVREGRAVYDNVKKFLLFMLPTNGGEALLVIAALIFGLTLPLTAVQVLWINMATASTLGLALAFEPAERNIMQRRPRSPDAPLFPLFFVWRIIYVSFLMMGVALGLFLWELNNGATLSTARTMAVNAVVFSEMFYLVCSRYITASVLNLEGMIGNRYVLLAIAAGIALQLLYTHAPFMQQIFGSSGLSLLDWSKVVAASFLVFLAAELEKAVVRGIRRRDPILRPQQGTT